MSIRMLFGVLKQIGGWNTDKSMTDRLLEWCLMTQKELYVRLFGYKR